ncbi:hypothetical protein [Pantoea sp. C2G6]|uniref:hypothetical protein n=1 Tax=Pantoea sp. C2G6 TaxID=3243084 RepID=UPI003ED92A08
MKWIIAIAFIALSSSCLSYNGISAEEILFNKVIEASKSSNRRGLSDKDYARVSEYLSQGKSRWIELYPILHKDPFRGVTFFQEGLNIAMAYALPENPVAVLKFVDGENVNEICGLPFIEPAPDEIRNYIQKTIVAIGKVKTGGYWKVQCINLLNRRFSAENLP